jgi:hypothetical protein
MNAHAQKLLMNLLIHIMHMLVGQGNIFSQEDRRKLAELTAQLQAAMDEGKPRRPQRPGK